MHKLGASGKNEKFIRVRERFLPPCYNHVAAVIVNLFICIPLCTGNSLLKKGESELLEDFLVNYNPRAARVHERGGKEMFMYFKHSGVI
jgi:hypothetical protein